MKWIRYAQELPQRWAYKKDIPVHLQRQAIRVQFRFETAWIVRDENKRVLFPCGSWADTLDFHLRTPGHVIGLRDLITANGETWADEWQSAMHDRITERLALT